MLSSDRACHLSAGLEYQAKTRWPRDEYRKVPWLGGISYTVILNGGSMA